MNAQEDAAQVDRQDPIPGLVARVEEWRRAPDARVRDEDIEPTGFLNDTSDRGLHRRSIGGVGFDRVRPAAVERAGRQLFGGARCDSDIPVDDRYEGAIADETGGDASPGLQLVDRTLDGVPLLV